MQVLADELHVGAGRGEESDATDVANGADGRH